jgi:hypothetical protein
MQVAVTNHAVERYQQRVASAEKLDEDSIRTVIRGMVESAFNNGSIQDFPGNSKQRLIPFSVGPDRLNIALGPNRTDYPGQWAVISILYDREIGKGGTGVTLGDTLSDEKKLELASQTKAKKARYLVRIGGPTSKEIYEASDGGDLKDLLSRRQPKPDEVEVFERRDFAIRTEYVIEPSK